MLEPSILDPLWAPWATIRQRFGTPDPLGPTEATVDPWAKLPCGHNPGIYFESHVDPKVDNSHQNPKKVDFRKTSRQTIDYRSVPKCPNMTPTPFEGSTHVHLNSFGVTLKHHLGSLSHS
jgi:hypothetical protein